MFNPLGGLVPSNPLANVNFGGEEGGDNDKDKDKKGKKDDKGDDDIVNVDEVDGLETQEEALDDIGMGQGADEEDDEDRILPPEVQAWIDSHCEGNKKYHKYYDLAKDRSVEDIKDLKNKRKWKVRLRRIQYTNYGDLGDFFLCFNFGWNFTLKRRMEILKAGQKKVDPKTGRQIEPKRRWKWVKKGVRGTQRYTQVRKNVAKGKTVEFADTIEFSWYGSYFDLYDKLLHVELWIWHEFSPNEYQAKVEKGLKSIASGSMNMSGSDWTFTTELRRKGKRELINVGQLDFQCVFQEVLEYRMALQNWTSAFKPPKYSVDENEGEEDDEVVLEPWIEFRLVTGGLENASKMTRSKSHLLKDKIRADDEVKADFGSIKREISFVGTRTDLEESVLHVTVLDDIFGPWRNEIIGTARIPLAGVVENGYLSSKLTRHPLSGTKCCNAGYVGPLTRQCLCLTTAKNAGTNGVTADALLSVGQVSGTLDVEPTERRAFAIRNALHKSTPARLYREFAQVGELYPPSLKDYPPYNYAYLCVHIISARDLIGADVSGLSDPYVTVEWAGQRVKTRIVKETLNPVFDEVLYFHVRSFTPGKVTREDLKEDPFLRITVWDWDEAGSSDLLGSAKVYLHYITGSTDDSEYPVRQPRRLEVLRKKRASSKKEKPVTIMTRQYQDELRLEGLPPGVDSFVKVAAYFRCPEGDLPEHDPQRLEEDGPLLVLPEMRKIEKQKLEECVCHGNSCGREQEGMCQTLHDMDQKLRPPAGTVSDERRKRFENRAKQLLALNEEMGITSFFAKDQYGDSHFLPSFLQPTAPPKSLFKRERESPSVPSEIKYLGIRSSQKENLMYEAAQLVRAIEFQDADSGFDGAININEQAWLSPNFFLNQKKGDPKAHVLLLANLFLGLNADVYVCVGRAACEDGRQAVPHVWLMTRHSNSECCVPYRGRKKVDGSKSAAALDTAADDDTAGDQAAVGASTLLPPGIRGSVKFWEATRGAYFAPLPNRWEGQNDEKEFQKFNKSGRMRQKEKKAGAKAKKRGVEDEVEDKKGAEGPQEHRWDEGKDPTEEDMLGGDSEALGDQFVELVEIFELGAGTEDIMAGNRTLFDMADEAATQQQEEDEEDGRGPARVSASKGASSRNLFQRAEETEESDSEPGSSDDEGEEEAAAAAADSNEVKSETQELKDHYKARKQFVRAHFAKCKGKRVFAMPYTELFYVFNHRNLWVNVQKSKNPRKMVFDMDGGEEFGWLPVYSTKRTSTPVTPHYATRTLGPQLTEETIKNLQLQMTQEVTSGIENFRDSHNVGTRFADEATQIPSLIISLLEKKYELDKTDRIKKNGWVQKENAADGESGTGSGGHWEARSIGYKAHEAFVRQLQHLEQTTPTGYTGRIQFCRVNSADPKEVRRCVLRRAEDGVALYEENHGGMETFAVGVKIVPYPNGFCIAYVGVVVIYPEPQRAKEQEAGEIYR